MKAPKCSRGYMIFQCMEMNVYQYEMWQKRIPDVKRMHVCSEPCLIPLSGLKVMCLWIHKAV